MPIYGRGCVVVDRFRDVMNTKKQVDWILVLDNASSRRQSLSVSSAATCPGYEVCKTIVCRGKLSCAL